MRKTTFVRVESTGLTTRSGREWASALSLWLVVACGGSDGTGFARTTDGSGGASAGSANGGGSGAGGRASTGTGGSAAGGASGQGGRSTGGAGAAGGTGGATAGGAGGSGGVSNGIGGTSNTGGGASGTGGVDGGGTDGGLCDGVLVGEPCAVENAHCGSCTDECSFCHVVSCVNGVWTGFEVPPLPCFDCGPSIRCRTGGEYCDLEHSDVPSIPDAYACRSMFAACLRDVTCDCVQQAVPSDRCTMQRAGELLVEHLGG
jgi:hypothetical protein